MRFRTALFKGESTDNRFRWRHGSTPCLYGLWELREQRDVVLVEGESDTHTLWWHGIHAVGIPGASVWKEERDAPHLTRYDVIYVVIEPDQGGESMLQWVKKSGLRDRVRIIRLAGFKDVSAMHVAGPEHFAARWQQALHTSIAWSDEVSTQAESARENAWGKCEELARDPAILDRLATHLPHVGLVGVEREAKLLYLALTSRVFDRVISVVVKGPSSAGKSYLVETVLSFSCPTSYYSLTAMSELALVYGQEPLQHRMLVLTEADAMASDMVSYLIRSLLSEGYLRYETVVKTTEGYATVFIERPGPSGLIVTTTRDSLHPENETRLISITLADSQDQTRAILDALAREDQGDDVDRAPWIALQQWIAASDAQVTIPFSENLVGLIPPIAVRLRRDARLLLQLIRAHALLHQASRKRDDRGRVVATLQDYAVVRALVAEFMSEGVQATVPATMRETVTVVGLIQKRHGSASVSEVAVHLGIDHSSTSRRCAAAARRGYLGNGEMSRGRPARYVLADPLPQEQTILPTVEMVAASIGRAEADVCTCAPEIAEHDTPLPNESKARRRTHKIPAWSSRAWRQDLQSRQDSATASGRRWRVRRWQGWRRSRRGD